MGKLLSIEPKQVNIELLDAELLAQQLPYRGQEGSKSQDGRHIIFGIEVDDDATDIEIKRIKEVIAKHDHTKLAPQQEQRILIVESARSAVGVHINSLNGEQVRALLVLLLKTQNAVSDDYTILPLEVWSPVQPPPQMVLG